MNARSFDAYTCSYGIDSVIIAFDCYFSTFTGYAGHSADVDESVLNFRNFDFEKATQEVFVGATYSYFGIVVFIVDIGDNGSYRLSLAEKVAWNRLAFWKQKLVFLSIEKESLSRPCLIYFTCDEFAFKFFEFLVDSFFLQIEYL